jgi:hypothetical protein
MVETIKQIVGTVGDNLKSQPLAFALIIVNLLFLGWASYVFNGVGEAGERRDQLIAQLVEKCGK